MRAASQRPRGPSRLGALALALLLAPAVPPTGALTGPQPWEPIASIRIVGDAAFADPASGVRSGSGTPGDPYVIREWSVLHGSRMGILLQDTRAHVVIEDVAILWRQGALHESVVHCIADVGTCEPFGGVVMRNASNVAVRRVYSEGPALAVVQGSENVRVEDIPSVVPVQTGYTFTASLLPGENFNRFEVNHSRNVSFRNVALWAASGFVSETHGFTVEDSRFERSGGLRIADNSTDVVVRRNTFVNTNLDLGDYTPIHRVRVEDNHLSETTRLWVFGGEDPMSPTGTSILVCGNTIDDDFGYLSMVGILVGGLRMVGNRVVHGSLAARWVEGLLVERNDLGPAAAIMEVEGRNARVAHNRFDAASGGLGLYRTADATLNWWGAPDGPSGEFAGSGAPVYRMPTATAHVVPWLSEPPPVDVDCAAQPLPDAVPFPPATTTTYTFPEPVAWRARINATGDDSVLVTSPTTPRGAEAAGFGVRYDPDTLEVSAWGASLRSVFTYAEANAHARVLQAPIRVATASDISWLSLPFEFCTGDECPRASLRASVGSDGGGPMTITVHTTGNATVELATGPVRLLASDTWDDEGALVSATALGGGASVNLGSAETIVAQHRLWGFTSNPSGGGVRNYTLERPDGTVGSGSNQRFFGAAPGPYTFRMTQAAVGEGDPVAHALVADLPP